MIRRLVPVLAVSAAALFAAVAVNPSGASAAKKAAATPAPSPTATPAATPEPLDKAIPRLESAIKANPGDKQSQAALGHQKEALADLENAANLEPTNAGVLGALTNMYLQLNRPQDAERVAKRAVTFNGNDENSRDAYGLVLAAEQKYDEARQQFDAAAKANPKDPRPLVLEAQTYVSQNAIALAEQLYDRATQIDPSNLDALVGKARLEAAQHNVKDAVATYERILALQTDPTDKVAVIDQEAVVYANEKMDGDAVAQYQRAITQFPTVLSAHTAYGEYLQSKNDKAGAEREYLAGAGPNKDQVDAIARLGQLYAGENQLGKAIEEFKRTTELAKNDPRSHLLLAASYAANKQFAQAAGEFKASYNLAHTPDALLGLGQADLQVHNYNECAQVYDALDRGAPTLSRQNPQILYGLGKCYQGSHQPDKAKSAYQKLLSYVPRGSQAANEVQSLINQIDREQKSSKTSQSKKTTEKKS